MTTMIQNNFVGGEISPSLHGRSDLKAYYVSAARVENFIVAKEGALRKRRGIETVGSGLSGLGDFRIFPYRYDRDNGGIVVIANVSERTQMQLRRKSSLGTVTASAVIHASPLSSAQLELLRVTQIGDTLFTNCQGVFNKKIVVNWASGALAVSDYTQTGKPEAVNGISASRHESDGSPAFPYGRTITYAAYVVKDGVLSDRKEKDVVWDEEWPAGYYINVTVDFSNVTDYDYIILAKKTGGSYGEVARWYPEDVESGNSVTFKDENISPGQLVYRQTNVLGNDWTPPLVTTAFQQRLVFANTPDYPMTLWFSEIGNLYNFHADRPAADDDPFSPTMHATGPAFIRWMVTYQRALILLTDSGVYSIAGSNTEGFSASTCQISKLSETACSKTVAPVETDSGVIFVGSDDKTLYTMAYDISTDSTLPTNQMQLVEHLTRGAKIRSIALQQFPHQVIWCVMSDGSALSFTYEKQQEVAAWARHVIDGSSFEDCVGIGSVTDSSTSDGRTWSDIAFVVSRDGTKYFAKFKDGAWTDTIAGTTTSVSATLRTLRAESQERTLAGIRKNVKDVLVRMHESGPLTVVPSNSDLAAQVLAAGETSFTGEAKAMPNGFVGDDGQLTFVSNGPTNCEITGIVYKMEVNG